MRTNIEIDDRLMAEALAATGIRTKRKAVELGLKAIIRRTAGTIAGPNPCAFLASGSA